MQRVIVRSISSHIRRDTRVERKEDPLGETRQDPAPKDPGTCTGLPALARAEPGRGPPIETPQHGVLYNFDWSINVRRGPPEAPRILERHPLSPYEEKLAVGCRYPRHVPIMGRNSNGQVQYLISSRQLRKEALRVFGRDHAWRNGGNG
eukprot:scaffold2077_cov333-Pavlova_lutheri.AAC.2